MLGTELRLLRRDELETRTLPRLISLRGEGGDGDGDAARESSEDVNWSLFGATSPLLLAVIDEEYSTSEDAASRSMRYP